MKPPKLPLSLGLRHPAGGGPSHGDRQHAQKFGKDRACGSEDMLANGHTHTHTHTDVIITRLYYRSCGRSRKNNRFTKSCLNTGQNLFYKNIQNSKYYEIAKYFKYMLKSNIVIGSVISNTFYNIDVDVEIFAIALLLMLSSEVLVSAVWK